MSPYRLEWNGGYFQSWDWSEIQSHPQFLNGTVFEFIPDIGWIAI